jgi:cytochrome c oxidase assembly protein subunit 15
MVGGIFYEHGHRMVATFVGFLTTILAIWIWQVEPRRWVRIIGLLALMAVILQGVLGGLTVLFLLPTPISVSHATLAQSFFSLIVFIALVTSRSWNEPAQQNNLAVSSQTKAWVLTASAVIFVQLVLGGLVRHMQAGLAIPDFPLSYGALVPPFDSSVLNTARLEYELPPVETAQVLAHFLHRSWALVVTLVVVFAVRHVLKIYPRSGRLREPTLILLMLVLIQFLLGALTIWTGKNIQVATAHVATGALLLAASVVLCARVLHKANVPMTSIKTAIESEFFVA